MKFGHLSVTCVPQKKEGGVSAPRRQCVLRYGKLLPWVRGRDFSLFGAPLCVFCGETMQRELGHVRQKCGRWRCLYVLVRLWCKVKRGKRIYRRHAGGYSGVQSTDGSSAVDPGWIRGSFSLVSLI